MRKATIDRPDLPDPDNCAYCQNARRNARSFGFLVAGCVAHYPLDENDEARELEVDQQLEADALIEKIINMGYSVTVEISRSVYWAKASPLVTYPSEELYGYGVTPAAALQALYENLDGHTAY